MPVPNRKTADTVRVCTCVWLQQATGLACNMGELLLNPGPKGALPRARCAACVNVNVNSLHRGPNHSVSTEEMFAK